MLRVHWVWLVVWTFASLAEAKEPDTFPAAKHDGMIFSVAWSHDGRLVASASPAAIRLWHPNTLVQHLEIQRDENSFIAFSKDDAAVIAAGARSAIRSWDTKTGAPNAVKPLNRAVDCLVLSHDGRTLALASGADLHLWNWESGEQTKALKAALPQVHSLCFSPNDKLLAVGGCTEVKEGRAGPALLVLETNGWKPLPVEGAPRGHTTVLSAIAFSPDGKYLATGSGDKTVKLWDAATFKLVTTFEHEVRVSSLAFTPDSRLLISCGGYIHSPEDGGEVCIWDVERRAVRFRTRQNLKPIHSMAVSPDGKKFITGGGTLFGVEPLSEMKMWHVEEMLKAKQQ